MFSSAIIHKFINSLLSLPLFHFGPFLNNTFKKCQTLKKCNDHILFIQSHQFFESCHIYHSSSLSFSMYKNTGFLKRLKAGCIIHAPLLLNNLAVYSKTTAINHHFSLVSLGLEQLLVFMSFSNIIYTFKHNLKFMLECI